MPRVINEDRDIPVTQGSPCISSLSHQEMEVCSYCPRLESRGPSVMSWKGSERGRPLSPHALGGFYMNSQIRLKPSSHELVQVVAEGVGSALSKSCQFFGALKEGVVKSQISGAGYLCMDLPK